MTEAEIPKPVFPTAGEDADAAMLAPKTAQTRSRSYRLAYADNDFLLRDELRPVRLQLELLKPELLQQENGIHSTIVIFGSTRIPDEKTAAQATAAGRGAGRGNIRMMRCWRARWKLPPVSLPSHTTMTRRGNWGA